MRDLRCPALLIAVMGLMAAAGPAKSDSRIVATGGASSLEGAAGGGIVPWAVIGGYGDRHEFGTTGFASLLRVDDFGVRALGAAVGIDNRVELSAVKQWMDIDSLIPGERLEMSVLGAKFRLFGELPYDRGPQVAIGLQLKQNDAFDVPEAVGAASANGVDIYLAASKLWLAGPLERSVFLNGTLRATRANQTGLLGFGTDGDRAYELLGEVSAGVFLNRHWVLGAEYRQKSDRLAFAREDDWTDLFVGWFPNKHLSIVAAYANLGSIGGLPDQRGAYLSLEFAR